MTGLHGPDGMGYRRTTRRVIEHSNPSRERSRLNTPKHTDRVLQLAPLKLESRVIDHEHGSVNVILTGVLTARHGLESPHALRHHTAHVVLFLMTTVREALIDES